MATVVIVVLQSVAMAMIHKLYLWLATESLYMILINEQNTRMHQAGKQLLATLIAFVIKKNQCYTYEIIVIFSKNNWQRI